MPTVPVVGMGKEGRISIDPWGYLDRKLPFIELLSLCRFSEVNAIGIAIAWPGELGNSPMAHNGSNENCRGKREGGVKSHK